MTSSCPDCGAEVEFEDREVHLRTGTCGACGHEFTVVAGTALKPGSAPAPEEGSPAEEGDETATPPAGTPECADCGTPLSFRALADGSLEASCEECETKTVFVERGEAPRGPPRGRLERSERGGPSGPRGRPCRQCGAPLRFTTNEEGSLVGECDSCGNKFVLPPRDSFGRGGGRGYGPPSRGRYGPPKGRGSYNRGPGGYGRKPGRYSGDRRERDDDRPERRRRRRPPAE